MKGIAGVLVAAVLLVVLGAAALAVGRAQRDMADGQEQLVTERYDDARASFDRAEGYLRYGRYLPGVGAGPLNEVRARKAAIQYWQKQYAAVLPAPTDPVSAADPDNPQLQLVVANAAYRASAGTAKDRVAMMQALDGAMAGYMTVLRGATWQDAAAYNYEYLARVRASLANGKRPPPEEQKQEESSFGQQGAPADTTGVQDFEIYIPLDSQERTTGGEAGKAPPKERKG